MPGYLEEKQAETNGHNAANKSSNGTSLTVPQRKPVTVPGLLQMKADGTPIAALTAYDYTMAVQVNFKNFFKNPKI